MYLISQGAESEALGQSRQSNLNILQFCCLDGLHDLSRTQQLQEGIAHLCPTLVPIAHDDSSKAITSHLLNELANVKNVNKMLNESLLKIIFKCLVTILIIQISTMCCDDLNTICIIDYKENSYLVKILNDLKGFITYS